MIAWTRRLAIRRNARLAAVFVLLLLVASAAAAQRRGREGGGMFGRPTRLAAMEDFDGGFQFCRIVFRQGQGGDGGGWGVDWPRADENLSIRLSELTKVSVGMEDGAVKPLLLRLTQEELFHCPFIMMTEPGGAFFDEQEAAALRTYLLKGGFLWADDFWGEYAWDYWENQLRKAMPSGPFPIVDLPLEHSIFHLLLNVPSIPQIPSIGAWDGRNRTSERGADSGVPHVRAILDDRGRIMVLMTHNTDFGDSYEREGDNHEYFERFSVPGYAFGLNTLVYAMTH